MVHFYEQAAGTDSSLVSEWMPKLQELLFAAGWTIEYADADAIGSGSSSVPAWDKAPVSNTDAGIAVYRMPVSSHDTRWYVRLRPGWLSGTTANGFRGIQAGTTHEAGVLSGGTAEVAPTGANVNVSGLEWKVAVSEDGFALIVGIVTTASPQVIVGRARLLTGATIDDLIIYNKGTGNTTANFAAGHARAGAGGVSTAPPVALTGHYFGLHSVVPSLESDDASAVVILGPYFTGGDPFYAPPRHALLASPTDVSGGQERILNIDGGNKIYKAMSSSVTTALGIWMVATQ
jgi:hypothetical protein